MDNVDTIVRSPEQIDHYLEAYDRLIDTAEWYATLDPPMDEGEQVNAHMSFMQYWGQRHLLSDLYLSGQFAPAQVERLAELDRKMLECVPYVEIAYGHTLRDLLSALYTWGTPLAGQAESVLVETRLSTLAELAGVTTDHQPRLMKEAS